MKKVLTIAGSDCSGGAGIQADIKTMTAHKVYAMSVITALTAQNTTGVYGVLDAGADFVGQQMDCVFKDIFPDAVKIGMVSNIETIQMIAAKLKEYNAKNIVVDPVMVSTSGCALMQPDAMDTLISVLLPMGDIITPNIPEAEKLCGFEIKNVDDMKKAAEVIGRNLSGSVLIKGGHLTELQMTFYTMTVNLCGIAENVSIIRTPTAQVVLYHLPSPAIWLWVMI